ncbi:MAG: cyclic nucleotide-binding domain-containing protein [candidate division NC10 bacterium]|jgi:CRP/FNR family transcriptional regulator/CRP/FNR family cyclic AMP-dependent transcriptional regulator
MGLIGRMFETYRVGRDEKIKHLERVPIFEDCSMKQLRRIADISTIVEVPERTVLCRAGEAGEEFFVLIDGTALVTLSPQRRGRISPGEFFGEMSLLDGEPRSATVKAETDLRLLVIDRSHFWALLREVPELTERILVTLSKRVRNTQRMLNG